MSMFKFIVAAAFAVFCAGCEVSLPGGGDDIDLSAYQAQDNGRAGNENGDKASNGAVCNANTDCTSGKCSTEGLCVP